MEELNRESIFDEEQEADEAVAPPFDPESISIDKKTVLVETCMKRLLQNTIILNPDIQRNEVWDGVRKSRLIESLMLKIPLPMFYVSADEKNTFTMVDGLQRLSSLRDFIIGKESLESHDEKKRGNGMKLQGLEFWTQYEGKTYNELPTYLQNRITETELTFTIVNPGTPDEVKRNIFKRINTGGLYLTRQEVRNALYAGKSTKLLKRLSETEEFLAATAQTVKPARMDDCELILRCLSFMTRDARHYPSDGNMDAFLSDTMQIINAYPAFGTTEIKKLVLRGNVEIGSIHKRSPEELEELFLTGMRRSLRLFGMHSFRRSYGNMKRSPINKALFEMWGTRLALLQEEEFRCIEERKTAFESAYHALLDDTAFQNLISRDSWKYASVQKRFEKIDKIVDQYKERKK